MAAWRGPATAPYLAAQAIARAKATHVLNVFPVAWATQRGSMTGGPGEVHATQSLKQNLEVPFGWFPQPVYFATIMRRHMIEFGTTPKPVRRGCGRLPPARQPAIPDAVMHGRSMTIDDYLASPVLADPLRLFDSCLISDGGAAYVTTSLERARDLPQPPAVVARRRRGLLGQRDALGAAARVHEHAAGVLRAGRLRAWPESARDVDVLTVYDPFTVVSLMQIEDMGFCAKGEAGAFVEGDTLHHDAGRLPFNTHGGLLSHAYVLGIAHVVECVKQLRGTAPAQVPGCEVAVYGGYTGHMASTLVLTQDR